MPGRLLLITPPRALAGSLGVDAAWVDRLGWVGPRYNITPGQNVLAALATPALGRHLRSDIRWGMIEPWAASPDIGRPAIEVCVTGIDERPELAGGLRLRRCVIPADGYYEWANVLDGGRQAVCVRPRAALEKTPRPPKENPAPPVLFLAGIWSAWSGTSGAEVLSCALLTRPAGPRARAFTAQVPVMLAPSDLDAWLDPKEEHAAVPEHDMLASLRAYPVRPLINNPRCDEPACVEPIPGLAMPGLLEQGAAGI